MNLARIEKKDGYFKYKCECDFEFSGSYLSDVVRMKDHHERECEEYNSMQKGISIPSINMETFQFTNNKETNEQIKQLINDAYKKEQPGIKLPEGKKELTTMSLESSVNKMGRYVTQIWHMSGGNKRTFHNIDTETIQDGSFCKMRLKDGRMLLVNTNNVDMIEVFSNNQD